MKLKIIMLSLFLTYSLNLWASNPLCEIALSTQSNVSTEFLSAIPANSTLELIELAGQLEEYIASIFTRPQNVNALKMAGIWLEKLNLFIEDIFNESKPIEELNNDILSLVMEVSVDSEAPSIEDPVQVSEEESEADSNNDGRNFLNLQPDSEIQVEDSRGNPYNVSFSEKFLSEIKNNRTAKIAREKLWKALLRGLTSSSNNEFGIKVMHTHDGTRFVEVKTIGGEAGAYRIFGCIEGNRINLEFLGRHIDSVSNSQRDRIKAICKKDN